MAARRRSLRVEIVATLAVVIMIAAVSLSLATELLGRRRHEALQRDRLAEHAQGLAAILVPLLSGPGVGSAHGAEVESVLRPSVGTLGITTIAIHRVDDQASATLLELGAPPDVPPPDREVARAITTLPDGRFVIDEPLRTRSGSSRMVLRLVADPSPWTRASDFGDIAILALGIGGIVFALGFVLVDAQVLRPLLALREGVRAVADGDLETSVPSDGPRELRDFAEAFNAMTQSLRDNLQQIEAQREQLLRSEQLASLGRIAAGTAHEIGNPLAAILGYVELLLAPAGEQALDQTQRTMLTRAREQLLRIQTTIRQMLDVSRPAEPTPVRIDLAEAIKTLLTLLRHDARCQDVALAVEPAADVHVRADPARLDRIAQNLVVNACRAARHGEGPPRVIVRIDRDDAHGIVDVIDNGPGVDDDVRPQLFQPFVTTAPAGEGTGLGLAISRGLAESMDGRLDLHDDSDRGATFRLRLPLA